MKKPESKSYGLLNKLLKERILFLDGAMGTMIQRYKLEEEDPKRVEIGTLKSNDVCLVAILQAWWVSR